MGTYMLPLYDVLVICTYMLLLYELSKHLSLPIGVSSAYYRRTLLIIVYSRVNYPIDTKGGGGCTDTVIHVPATTNTSTILVVRISPKFTKSV